MRKKKGFTLIELLVVISIIALLIGILLPALGAARRTARKMKNSHNMKEVLQALVLDSQNRQTAGGAGRYVGVDRVGRIINMPMGHLSPAIEASHFDDFFPSQWKKDGRYPGTRFALLLSEAAISPDVLLNPQDNLKAVAKADSSADFSNYNVTSGSATGLGGTFSYALLRIHEDPDDDPPEPNVNQRMERHGRSEEWSETNNGEAVVISDRNTGDGTGGGQDDSGAPLFTGQAEDITDNKTWSCSSPWTELTSGEWEGSVGFNDGHVDFKQSLWIGITRYGSRGQPVQGPSPNNIPLGDNLFSDENGATFDDAGMVYHEAAPVGRTPYYYNQK